ncbi:MAG TPA: zinc-ribbon domain containing protein [Candidatus Polarisedimenticolia bacterium]|nr:zinc-ribbon domain containing protein [Candidatus Polarisedimenticolia bacterium]
MKRKAQRKIRTGQRIKADLSKQSPNNSYSPPLYYEDVRFKCRDCGTECMWTAEQQRLWYEEWGGPVQSTAVRCRACRQRLRREKAKQKKHMEEMALKKEAKGGGR